jgi:amidohydrolase
MAADFADRVDDLVSRISQLGDELIDIRRDLHAHPELAWEEKRTTLVVGDRLDAMGVAVQLLPRTGLIAEVGDPHGPVVALRGDLDALPVQDTTTDDWRSTYQGLAHACGHDVHTAALLGAGLALRAQHADDPLPGLVRLLFQPAEEMMPGGALEVIAAGSLDSVQHVFGLHCDPSVDVGTIGLREGPLTGAADSVSVHLSGRGGHTSRPHLTEDLTYALAKVVTDLPAVLSRRLDPRAGASLVWGMVRAGSAKNVIPATGEAMGTLRMLDATAWDSVQEVILGSIHQLVAPYGLHAEVDYIRGVPPVINHPGATAMLQDAAEAAIGEDTVVNTTQSLGGEDFAWYLESVPGAMARLGTRTPGGPTYDLHQGNLRVDDESVLIGAKLLGAAALRSLLTDEAGGG